MIGFVYILRSLRTNKFYIGSTNDLNRRLIQHQSGESKYTKDTGPYKLEFSQEYENLLEARKVERWLKAQKSAKLLVTIIENKKIMKKF